MDGHQVSLAARGGATGGGRTGASDTPINSNPSGLDNHRTHPNIPDNLRRQPSLRGK